MDKNGTIDKKKKKTDSHWTRQKKTETTTSRGKSMEMHQTLTAWKKVKQPSEF